MGLLVSYDNSTKNFGGKQEKQGRLKESVKFENEYQNEMCCCLKVMSSNMPVLKFRQILTLFI